MIRLLITGASGYIGGEILAQMSDDPHKYGTIEVFAVYRKEEHGEAIRKMGSTPVKLDLSDGDAIKSFILEKQIDVVLELTDPVGSKIAIPSIEALSTLGGERTFIYTSGGKLFSAFADFDTLKETKDDDEDVINTLRNSNSEWIGAKIAKESYPLILETGKKLHVHTHIVVPPMVYGKSRTFGNQLSKQIVELVKIAKTTGKLWTIPQTQPSLGSLAQIWALCHIHDCASGYLALLDSILANKYAPDGIYFEENGKFAWEELSKGILRGLGLEEKMDVAGQEEMVRIADILGTEVEGVAVQMSGRANLKGNRLKSIGWHPKYDVEHLYSTMEDEARFIASQL
ncbi:hypothetical protein BCR39DRAFT_539076 [Naematelia encephala]|uniref:NAD-dependent epimerase/dehydratase domain-containing protein n=1 Tax=Naematelia encephala TaxID=71784 RepID=A0A1Y2AWT6_9TREE|nr:hypothetical protein BCR39DRAFT_539076 [Naematelia encephala]